MKAKVILYGWCISWFFLFVGAGAMDNGKLAEGSKEADRFESWFTRLLGGSDKG